MNDTLKTFWRHFLDWVEGNGPRPKDEVMIPEPPPRLPFSETAPARTLKHCERSIRERYDEWMECRGPQLFSRFYSGMSVLTCIVLVGLLLLTVSELPRRSEEHTSEIQSQY